MPRHAFPRHAAPISLPLQWFKLTKPGIVASNAMMATAGALLAGGTAFEVLAATLGCALLVAGSGASNMAYEKDVDIKMPRTKNRPVASGVISVGAAFSASAVFIFLGSVILFALDPQAMLLGLLATLLYLGLYTPLKQLHTIAIPVGALSGAFPPMIGWAAVHPDLAWTPVVMFAAIFVWQLPHFYAISIRRHADYRAAGLKIGADPRNLSPRIVGSRLYSVVLVGLSVVLVTLTGWVMWIPVGVAVLAALMTMLPVKDPSSWALRSFFAGLAYLPSLALAAALAAV